MMLVIVEASKPEFACLEAMNECGENGECDLRCKAQHSDGKGSCGFGHCVCSYTQNCTNPTPLKINAAMQLDYGLFISMVAVAVQCVVAITIFV
ncbi:hypothetical protein Lal_00003691 [Lupinus albus]|nr:hypothetical protein Lal_00003691 [Lupinus albus]